MKLGPLDVPAETLEAWRGRPSRRGTVLALGLKGPQDPLPSAWPHGGTLVWEGRAELPFIGSGPLPFERFALVRFPTPDDLEQGLMALPALPWAAAVEDSQMLAVRPLELPSPFRWFLRLLRRVGPWLGFAKAHPAPPSPGGPHYPTPDQQAALATLPADQPSIMINWLAFEGRDGARLYQRYARVAIRNITLMGGAPLFIGRVEAVLRDNSELTGDGDWDQLALVAYPRLDLFASLPQTPGYAAAAQLRRRGLRRTALVVTRPVERSPRP